MKSTNTKIFFFRKKSNLKLIEAYKLNIKICNEVKALKISEIFYRIY